MITFHNPVIIIYFYHTIKFISISSLSGTSFTTYAKIENTSTSTSLTTYAKIETK